VAAASTAREGASPACAAVAHTATAVGARVQQHFDRQRRRRRGRRPPAEALGRLGEASARARVGPAGSSG
jgi:hypothetical protein